MTAAQLAEALGCEVETVHERTNAGDLPGVKFGRSWYYPVEALRSWLNEVATAEAKERKSGKRFAAIAEHQAKVAQPLRKPGKSRAALPSLECSK